MSKNSKALFRARYMCNAGLRSEVVIPLLMDELKHLVRFGCWVFVWSDAQGQLINSATSPLRPETLRYLSEHFECLARDVGFSVHDAMQTFPDVSNPWRTGRINTRMDETESYCAVWGPEGCYRNLTVAIRGVRDAPLGLIQVFRPKEDEDFQIADEQALRDVLPYLRRLLECEMWRATDAPLMDDGRPGVAVFREDHGPLFVSERAFSLATMAFNDHLPISTNGLQLIDPAERLREMHDEVRSAQEGGAAKTSLVRTRSNEWGAFSFEWERSLQREAAVWSVVIRQRVPLHVRLMGTPESTLLSERQLEVCRRLLEGEPTPLIAQRIGVKRATLKDHTREIYRKFGVRDRDDLLRKIVNAAPCIPS